MQSTPLNHQLHPTISVMIRKRVIGAKPATCRHRDCCDNCKSPACGSSEVRCDFVAPPGPSLAIGPVKYKLLNYSMKQNCSTSELHALFLVKSLLSTPACPSNFRRFALVLFLRLQITLSNSYLLCLNEGGVYDLVLLTCPHFALLQHACAISASAPIGCSGSGHSRIANPDQPSHHR